MIDQANWIWDGQTANTVSPVFQKEIAPAKPLRQAVLQITALGLYEASIDGARVGDALFTPGWTAYNKRLQYQTYDVTEQLRGKSAACLQVTLGNGWCVGRLAWENAYCHWAKQRALLASVQLQYEDGTQEEIVTGPDWQWAPGPVQFSELYDGETYDARIVPQDFRPVCLLEYTKDILIPQEGEAVKEHERIAPVAMFTTPKGETVLDFGQNLTGYVTFRVKGEEGQRCEFSHAEVLDKDGNFYTGNLRTAKNHICVILGQEELTYHPHSSFQGFRYVRIDSWPGQVNPDDFRAVAVHSDIKRTGDFSCSSSLLNQLYHNIIWGQKSNFLDVPTDCPQRDERLGWTGDAQVFVRAASYNFDVAQFFHKWLHDLAAEQAPDGGVPHVIPDVLHDKNHSAAWGDAAVICPWQIYLTYGDRAILEEQFNSMRSWVEYMRSRGDNEFLWKGDVHFGDWLAMDAPEGECVGATDLDLIATAYYAYSTSLLIKAGKALGKDMAEYEALYQAVTWAFRREFLVDGLPRCQTQTAYVLALYFHLTDRPHEVAAALARMIRDNGNKLSTGFVGTPYLLHALTENGYAETAYTLLLQEEYPSWLYSVNKGATTVWEHWDSIKPDGSMWSDSMNSFNHYAYGSVADFLFGKVAGINPDENKPGYAHVVLAPVPDQRLGWVKAQLETRHGLVKSAWRYEDGHVIYDFDVPQGATATIRIAGETREVQAGHFQYIR